MTWMTLGTALENALASMMNDGDEVAGTRLDASKVQRTPGPKPRPVLEETIVPIDSGDKAPAAMTTQPAEAASLANGKSIATASPTRRPTSAVVIDLVLEAGRTDCPVYEQHASAALSPSVTPCGASAHETAPARRQARILLRVIEGGGRRQGGQTSAAFRAHTGGGGRGRKLMLVVG